MTEYQSVYNMKKKENFICITDRKIILDLKMEVIHQSNVPLGSICTKGEEKNKNQDKTICGGEMMGQIWFVGHSFLSPGLDERH